jgi:hypothetical protein
MLAGMHALTTRAITHDSTTFEAISINVRALGLYGSCNNQWSSCSKVNYTESNYHCRTLQLAGHTRSHPDAPFEVCLSRITANIGHKVHKDSASTDGTVAMPLHGATMPSACKNNTIRHGGFRRTTTQGDTRIDGWELT